MSENLERKMESLPENIIIPDLERFETIKRTMIEQGVENLHVVSDFDRTLTKCIIDGQKSPTAIAQIRNEGYLGEEYVKKAHALFDRYHPIEIDPSVSFEEKNAKMHEWWMAHFDILIEYGLTRDVIREVASKKSLQFREGSLDLIDSLYKKSIPLVIMSASLGDMIYDYLEQEGKMYDNIEIVANLFDFDDTGRVLAVKQPIVHSVNKSEIVLEDFARFEKIRNRKNIILLGDGVGDTGMVEGFSYNNLIKIGFLNEEVEKNISDFKDNFDIIITGDSDTRYINDLVAKIVN